MGIGQLDGEKFMEPQSCFGSKVRLKMGSTGGSLSVNSISDGVKSVSVKIVGLVGKSLKLKTPP